MEELSAMYISCNKQCYDIDGKINEVYVGFKDQRDLDDTAYVIRERIDILRR